MLERLPSAGCYLECGAGVIFCTAIPYCFSSHALQDNNLKVAKTLFYHPNSDLQQAVIEEVTRCQGQGVSIWLEAWDELDLDRCEKASVFLDLIHGRILPLATVFVTNSLGPVDCEQRISKHLEILMSVSDQIAHYISQAKAETQPSSFVAKLTDYLSVNPHQGSYLHAHHTKNVHRSFHKESA